jgi:hypothetical protein
LVAVTILGYKLFTVVCFLLTVDIVLVDRGRLKNDTQSNQTEDQANCSALIYRLTSIVQATNFLATIFQPGFKVSELKLKSNVSFTDVVSAAGRAEWYKNQPKSSRVNNQMFTCEIQRQHCLPNSGSSVVEYFPRWKYAEANLPAFYPQSISMRLFGFGWILEVSK